jgi:hypothetical protein
MMMGACSDPPTEVVLNVFSDVPCNAQVAVAVGNAGELGDRSASATSNTCDPATGSRGVLVLVPKSSDTGELAMEIRIRADQADPENCLASEGYDGCIIARRILNYIPGRSVSLRVDLKNPCLNTPCTQTTSCVAQGLGKSCVVAHLDPTQCSGTCTDEDLVSQAGAVVGQGGAGGTSGTGGAPGTSGTPGLSGASGAAGAAGAETAGAAGADENAGSAGAAGAPPLDPCENDPNPCGEGTTCVARGDQASCECLSGYEPDPGHASQCRDIDECATSAAVCGAHSSCSNTAGSFECPCDSGYSGAGAAAAGCVDVDECKNSSSTCASNATCTNTLGAFICQCPPDHSGDGQTCTALCAPAPAALAAWWSGDTDGAELIAGHNAKLTSLANETTPGASTIALAGAPSPVKGGFDFSGTDWYASIPDDPALDVGTGDFSIALWVNTTCASNGVCVFLDKRDPTSYVGYSFYTYNGQLGLQLTDVTNGPFNYNGGGFVTDGQWHFAVVSVARNSATGMHFYVDNVLVMTSDPTGRKLSLDNASELRFAMRSVSANGQLTLGKLDEIQLYKQALVASDVQVLWAAAAHGVCK